MARRVSQPGFSRQEEVRIGPLSRIRSVPFAGLLLLGLLASGFAGALPSLVRFLIAVSIISWIPGAVLTGRFLRIPLAGPLERAVVWFALGLGGVSLLTWFAMLTPMSFDGYAAAIQWLLASYFATASVLEWRERRRTLARADETAGNVGAPAGPGTVGAFAEAAAALPPRLQSMLVAVAAVLAVAAVFNPPRLDFHQDALDHIGYVRLIDYDDSLAPAGVLAPPKDAPADAVKADPRKGTLHPIAALVARLTAMDPVDVWGSLPVVLFPMAFLAFAWFCTPFLPRPPLVLACAALFLLFQGGAGVLDGPEFANGQGVCLVCYWTLVPLCLRYVAATTNRRRLLLAVLLVFAGGALMHVGVTMHFAVLLGTLLVFHRWFGLRSRPVVALCAWAAGAAAVILVWKALHSFGGGNEIHVHPQGLMYLSGRLFIVSPIEVLRQNGLLFLGGLVLIPFLLFGARKSRHARLVLGFGAIPYLICFFPPAATVAYRFATYMTFRSLLNVPVFAAIVTAVFAFAVWARGRGWAVRAAAAVILAVWAKSFFVPSLDAFAREASARRASGDGEVLQDRYGDLLKFVKTLPDGSVVLSDPCTSYLISAVADQRVVAVLGQHGNPNDRYAFERLAVVRDVLSPFVLLPSTVDGCERFGVDYIVVNGRLRKADGGFLVNWDAAQFGLAREKLSNLVAHLRPVFETDDIVVYVYYPGSVPENVWSPPEVPVDFDSRVELPCYVVGPDNVFMIVHADVSPLTVLPGEAVTITLGYEKYDVHDYQLPFNIYIRFDHESVVTAEREYPGEKLVRRWRERRGGYLLRHRVDHRPFGGTYPLDLWPVGVRFFETFEVTLPQSLEQGLYTIEFSIERDALIPNFTARDLFYNRDHYSGLPCLAFEVTRQLVR